MKLRTTITGTKYRGRDAVTAVIGLLEGDEIELKRDRESKHDLNCIECHFRGRMIGFIPKRHNYGLAAAMDAGIMPRVLVKDSAISNGGDIREEPVLWVEWSEPAP